MNDYFKLIPLILLAVVLFILVNALLDSIGF
jgi:hypothetical protein